MIKHIDNLRLIKLLLLTVLCLVSCNKNRTPESSSTEDTAPPSIKNEIDDFIYESDGKEITITGYSGIETAITIPEEIDGLPVTSVAENAFRDFLYLKRIVISDTIKTIDLAFVSCEDLEYVFIGKGVTSMNGAFRGCKSLTTVAGCASVEYMDEAFFDCTSLDGVKIPSSAKSALSTFSGCSSLKTVTICEGITCLDKTFQYCPSLKSVHIPKSVNYLNYSFSECVSLSEITGGENVSFYNSSFKGCINLKEICLGENITELIAAFDGCSSLKEIGNLPLKVEKYEPSFSGCKALNRIVIPDIIDTESLHAYSPSDDFHDCLSVETIEIYANYTVKEEFCKAFSGLLSLKNLTIPEETEKQLLRVSYSISDSVYEGPDKKVAAALKKSKTAKTVRITDNYATVNNVSYSHIYGSDVYEINAEDEAENSPIIGFSPFELNSYWCGYPTGGNRKKETIAIIRTYSFFLRTTGKNTGTLPGDLIVNGLQCVVGE